MVKPVSTLVPAADAAGRNGVAHSLKNCAKAFIVALIDQGNTVVVIEHNLEVIKTADYIIDIGPEGGDKGGEIVAAGTPEDLVKVKKSYTGQYLAPCLALREKARKSA